MSWENAASRLTCDAAVSFKMCRRFVQATPLQGPDEVRKSARTVGWCCLVVSEIDYCHRSAP